MFIQILSLASLAFLTLPALADDEPVDALVAFESETGVYFRLPTDENRWVAVDDESSTCRFVQSGNGGEAGVILHDGAAQIFLSRWGVAYGRANAQATWTVSGRGLWLESASSPLTWSHPVAGEGQDPGHQRRLFWHGDGKAFANDPRRLVALDPDLSPYAISWYVLEGTTACSVLEEKSTRYGRPNLQTTELGPRREAGALWVLSTGHARLGATRIPGDWLR